MEAIYHDRCSKTFTLSLSALAKKGRPVNCDKVQAYEKAEGNWSRLRVVYIKGATWNKISYTDENLEL